MAIPTYIINAFTDQTFLGNPAAVCCLDQWESDDVLQNIACENRQPVTAFIVKQVDHYEIRWFSLTNEMDLCGHGSLSAVYVIAYHYQHPKTDDIQLINFAAGKFSAKILSKDTFQLKYPRIFVGQVPLDLRQYGKLFKSEPKELWYSDRLVAVFKSEEEVLAFKPNLAAIRKMDGIGLVITAKGSDCDFVSRYFTPKLGINEDAVTGSSHLTLTLIWAKKLRKNKMYAKQLSKRGGGLLCELQDDHVLLSAQAKQYMSGNIEL